MNKVSIKDFKTWSPEDRVRYLRYLKFEGVRKPEMEELLSQAEQVELLKTKVPSLLDSKQLNALGDFSKFSEKKKASILKSIQQTKTNPYGPFVPGETNTVFTKEEEAQREIKRKEVLTKVMEELNEGEETWLSLWQRYDQYRLQDTLLEFLPMATVKKWKKCFDIKHEEDEAQSEKQRCIYSELKGMKKDKVFREALSFYNSIQEYKEIYDKYQDGDERWFKILFYDSNPKNKPFKLWKKDLSPRLLTFETMIHVTKRLGLAKESWQQVDQKTEQVISVVNQLKRMTGEEELALLKASKDQIDDLIERKEYINATILRLNNWLKDSKNEEDAKLFKETIQNFENSRQEKQKEEDILKEKLPKILDSLAQQLRKGIQFVQDSPQMVKAFEQATIRLLAFAKTPVLDLQVVYDYLKHVIKEIKRASSEIRLEVKYICTVIHEDTEIDVGYIGDDESVENMLEYDVRGGLYKKINLTHATEVLMTNLESAPKQIADRIYLKTYLSTLKYEYQQKLFVLLTLGTEMELPLFYRDDDWDVVTSGLLSLLPHTKNPRATLDQIAEDVDEFYKMMRTYFANPGRIKDVLALTKQIVQEVFQFKRNKEIKKVLSLEQLGSYLLKSILKTKPEDESVKPKLTELNEKLRETFLPNQRGGGSFSDTVAALGSQVLKSKMKDLANWLNQKKPQIVNAVNQALVNIIPFATIADPADKILPLLYVVQPELLAIKSVPLGETVMKAIINYSVRQALNNLKDLPNYVNSVLTTVIQKLNDGDIEGLKKMISF